MFKQRLFTTLVFVPVVLLSIYHASPWALGLIVLALVVIGGWEWAQLIPIKSLLAKIFFILILLVMVGLCRYWLGAWLIAGLTAWIVILMMIVTYPSSQSIWGYPIVVGGACYLLMPLFANALAGVYSLPAGKDLVVYLLCLVWAADIGAYLIGKGWGKTKLIPQVSPGKTIEGTLGGMVMSMFVALVAYFYFSPYNDALWFGIAVGTALISVFGDLFISILKRRCKLKDTGRIFPGHGGVLDRFDSLIAALPLFYFGLNLLSAG